MAKSMHEVVTELGITPRALRFWEKCGMIHPEHRDKGDARFYSDKTIDRIRLVILCSKAGIPLKQVKKAMQGDQIAFPAPILNDLRIAHFRIKSDMDRMISNLDAIIMNDHADDGLVCEKEAANGDT